MNVLFDCFCDDDLTSEIWQGAVREMVDIVTEAHPDNRVFVITDPAHEILKWADAKLGDRIDVVPFPRRHGQFMLHATEADLLTKVAVSHDIDAVVCVGESYVVGIPLVVVRLDEVAEETGRMPTHGTALDLTLATALASGVVVSSSRAAKRVRAAYPFFDSSHVVTASPSSRAKAIVTLVSAVVQETHVSKDASVDALVSDYQRRARRMQS